jgi:hypothetical protein
MQQFTVPQFIDVESKIIGPITARQFLIFLGAAIIIAISYRLFDFSLFITITAVIAVISSVFAFLKINSRPFHFFVLNFIQTMRRPNVRVWNHKLNALDEYPKDISIKKVNIPEVKEVYQSSRLADLALVVDTKGRYRGDDE